ELAATHAARGDTLACDVAYARFTRLALPEQRHSEAGVALANNRLATAESLLRRQLAHSPQDVAAMRMLAQIAAEREDYAEAERLLQQCLELEIGRAHV